MKQSRHLLAETILGRLPQERKRLARKAKLAAYAISYSGASLLCPASGAAEEGFADAIPSKSYGFLETYCLDCHDDFEKKAEISLESPEVNWGARESLALWERVFHALRDGQMPPEEERQPDSLERSAMIDWLDQTLTEHSPIGGAPLRRLNRREYLNTINELLGIDYELPVGFPADNQARGFDNQGDALMLSGALMAAYSSVATDLAEKLFPPPKSGVEPSVSDLAASDFTYAYSSGLPVGDAMRVVSSSERLAASATWPSRFEAAATGVYRIELDLSVFNPPPGESIRCAIHAVDLVEAPGESIERLRLLREIWVDSLDPVKVSFTAVLEKGQTIAVRYDNAVLKEDGERLTAYLRSLFDEEPSLAAAYQEAGGVVERGRLGWERLKRLMRSEDLPEPPTGQDREELIKKILKNLRITAEVMQHRHFEEGPALDVRSARVYGPARLANSEEERYWEAQRRRLLGSRQGRSDDAYARDFLMSLLEKAFRRPGREAVFSEYWDVYKGEQRATGRMESGLHLAFRSILTSPYFLYRGFNDGKLDNYDLASRLSYFLVSAPPDDLLMEAARQGGLNDPAVLRQHASRLLDSKSSDRFIQSFLDQWLDLAALADLVPDRTLFPDRKVFDYGDEEKMALIAEPNLFFREMLEANRPVEDFIDPDFTYTNASIGAHVYELDMEKGKRRQPMHRVDLARGGRFGGVLGMAGVMAATANGVDTQPVVRGVWVLENILGNPTPEPPDAVPALTPDTSKAETPREMLAAHMSEESCSACHKKIDPLGFVLESFDPIGRWRTHYPNSPAKSGAESSRLRVETDGVLPDGTQLRDVRDLKAYLVDDISPFAECLSEKLLTYATGREMNYRDRKRIASIVQKNSQSGGGFRDLLLDLIDSESFGTK